MDFGKTIRRYLVSADPQITLAGAAREMSTHGMGALPIVDRTGRLLGLVTETDVVTAVAQDRDLKRTPAEVVMSRNPAVFEEELPEEAAVRMMTTSNLNHLPVVRDGRLVGMISSRAMLRHLGRRLLDGSRQPA